MINSQKVIKLTISFKKHIWQVSNIYIYLTSLQKIYLTSFQKNIFDKSPKRPIC